MLVRKVHKDCIHANWRNICSFDADLWVQSKNCNNTLLELGPVIPENISKNIAESSFTSNTYFATDIELD